MRREETITIKINLEQYHYPDDWNTDVTATFNNEDTKQTVTLKYSDESFSTVMNEIKKDIEECLEDVEEWFDEKVKLGDDMVAKIREYRKALQSNREEIKYHKGWVEIYEKRAAENEAKLKALEEKLAEKDK